LALTPRRILKALILAVKVLLALGICYVLILVGVVVWTFEVKLNRWPIFIYSAPFWIEVGDDLSHSRLVDRLTRLGYVRTSAAVPEISQWTKSGSGFNVNLKHSPLKGEDVVSGPISLNLDWNRVSSIRLMRSLEDVPRVTFEPELLSVIPAKGEAPELCRPVPLEAVPQLLVDSIILTEDTRFFTHQGIDLSSIVDAVRTNIRAGRYVQGGSTISQQLVRMAMLNPEKTLGRKTNEILLAIVADALYSKKTILQGYLNRVYLGHWGAYPIKGVAEASQRLFGKDLSELDAGECALIAATIRAPNVINPHKHPERALGRRNTILGLLLKAGKISRDTYDEAIASPVKMLKQGGAPLKASAFLELVKERLPAGIPSPSGAGQDVITSLDPLLQHDAELGLKSADEAGIASHLILGNPETGELKAYIAPSTQKWSGAGGAIETFAPFVIIPALIPDKPDRARFTLTSQLFIPTQSTAVTLRQAFRNDAPFLVESMVSTLGMEKILTALRDFGVNCRASGQSLAVDPMTPMEMAQSFSILATLGTRVDFGPGIRIVGESGPESTAERRRVAIKPAVLFLTNYLLKALDPAQPDEGTQNPNWARPSVFSARDSDGTWGIAYRNEALLVVRVHGIHPKGLNINKLVARFFRMPDSTSVRAPDAPEGILFRKICVLSGLRATSICPRVICEPFLKGTQPAEWCPHRHESAPVRSERED
jgi:penicillin-binding protein 1B